MCGSGLTRFRLSETPGAYARYLNFMHVNHSAATSLNITPLQWELTFDRIFLYLNPKRINILKVEELEAWYPSLSLSSYNVFMEVVY
jgi:hypothetical protein